VAAVSVVEDVGRSARTGTRPRKRAGTRPETRTPTRAPELAPQLNSRRWLRRDSPFPHWVAYDVFAAPVYDRLERAFRAALDDAAGRPYLEAHDIAGRTVTSAIAPTLEPVTGRPFHDLLAGVLGLAATGHVACGLHHHEVGSSHGFAHNDLNPGWFARPAGAGEVVFSDEGVEYSTGTPRHDDVAPLETVRAASLLYYLANPPWTPGDGGVTGLYRSEDDDIENPVASVPPINNSLLLFECRPDSFHGFVSNRRLPRNSIVMWLHRTKADLAARWGSDAIVPYGVVPPKRRTR
jgi:hypothetical protein